MIPRLTDIRRRLDALPVRWDWPKPIYRWATADKAKIALPSRFQFVVRIARVIQFRREA